MSGQEQIYPRVFNTRCTLFHGTILILVCRKGNIRKFHYLRTTETKVKDSMQFSRSNTRRSLLGGATPRNAVARMLGGDKNTSPAAAATIGVAVAMTTQDDTTTRSDAVHPTKISTKRAFEHGQSLIESKRPEESSPAKTRAIGSSSVMSGAMPLVAKPQVTPECFIDALTAVMTGKVELSDNDDDDQSVHTISTIASKVTLAGSVESKPRLTDDGSQSLGVGQLFFYLEQQSPLSQYLSNTDDISRSMTLPTASMTQDDGGDGDDELSEHERSPSRQQQTLLLTSAPHSVPMDEISISPHENHESEEKASEDDGNFNIKDLIRRKAREADREGLFEIGASMYRKGQLLLEKGKIEEARDALERAQTFQKHSLRLITKRMAESMHQQGLEHCDRGDQMVAVILLGVAEILKNRPTPGNIKFGAEVHAGYRKMCPRDRKLRAMCSETTHCVDVLAQEATPMAETLRAYAESVKKANSSQLAS